MYLSLNANCTIFLDKKEQERAKSQSPIKFNIQDEIIDFENLPDPPKLPTDDIEGLPIVEPNTLTLEEKDFIMSLGFFKGLNYDNYTGCARKS